MTSVKSRSIYFRIDWRDPYNGVECKTIAGLSLVVNDALVWPFTGENTGEFEWFVDEFLSHLTECWKPLVLRQTYPIAVQPECPSLLLAEAHRRWSNLPDSTVEDEEDAVNAFEDVHNLANAFGGVTGLLPLWFFRDNDKMIIDTQEQVMRVPIQDAIDALADVGNSIAERLKMADGRKWSALLNAWQHRDHGDGAVLLALSIGRDRTTAAALIEEDILESPASVTDAANDRDELRIAARMAGPIPVNQVKSVIEKLRDCERRDAPRLEEASSAASNFIKSSGLEGARPYVQGSELAKWLRRQLNVSDNLRVNPIDVLERVTVLVRFIDFGFRSLDSVAVWGPKHGPAVILNTASERVRPSAEISQHGGIRSNAAHELCHILLDLRHMLSAVEILGGRMPTRIEQRANAFAAEFLLPNSEAAAVWRKMKSPLDLDGLRKVIDSLSRKHKVTASVAAWQLEHGIPPPHQETLAHALNQLVPHR